MINASRETIQMIVSRISTEFNSIPHSELIALCASLKANLDLFEMFTGIEKQIDLFNELYKQDLEDDQEENDN